MDKLDKIVDQLDELQGDLFGYIMSLCGNWNEAKDILQESNLVIIRKIQSFEEGTSFRAWCFTIARFQVMAHRKKKSREKLVFSESTFNDIAAAWQDLSKIEKEQKFARLEECIDKLPEKQQSIIRNKYFKGLSLKDIAALISSNENSVSQALFRARKNLIDCVGRIIRKEEE